MAGGIGAGVAPTGLDMNDGGRESMPLEGLEMKEDNLFGDLVALALSALPIGVSDRDTGVACLVAEPELEGEYEAGRGVEGRDAASRSRLNKPKRLRGISAVCTRACTMTSVPAGGNCCRP